LLIGSKRLVLSCSFSPHGCIPVLMRIKCSPPIYKTFFPVLLKLLSTQSFDDRVDVCVEACRRKCTE